MLLVWILPKEQSLPDYREPSTKSVICMIESRRTYQSGGNVENCKRSEDSTLRSTQRSFLRVGPRSRAHPPLTRSTTILNVEYLSEYPSRLRYLDPPSRRSSVERGVLIPVDRPLL